MHDLSDRLGPEPPDASSRGLDDLYRAHASWLTAALRRRFGRGLSSEDLVQDTYLRAAQLMSTHRLVEPRAWLWRVAERLAFDQLRRVRRGSAAAQVLGGPQSSAPSQEGDLLLTELLVALPPKLRETFCLSRFTGLSYEEIAQKQAISVKTVEWRISRALAILTARLAE